MPGKFASRSISKNFHFAFGIDVNANEGAHVPKLMIKLVKQRAERVCGRRRRCHTDKEKAPARDYRAGDLGLMSNCASS